MPQKAEANETSSPDESPSFRWLNSVLTAYETDARTTASVPTDAGPAALRVDADQHADADDAESDAERRANRSPAPPA